MSLQKYRAKRDFERSPEPAPKIARGRKRRFVIQKHAATRLHYDFRLELGGTLKSWALPKGMPLEKGEKRLAVHVEDHPVAYRTFEGTIPKGEYGGGTVMVWDEGTFETEDPRPLESLEKGKLHFTLHGKKLTGPWHLVRLRDENQWLVIRGGDDHPRISKKADDTSVRSGHSMAQIARDGAAEERGKQRKAAKKVPARERSAPGRAKPARKEPARKVPARKDTAPKEPVRKAPARKTPARKSPARKSPARKSPARKSPARRKPAGAKSERATTARRRSAEPVVVAPMNALLVAAPPPGDWLYEIKFDGYRAVAHLDGDSVRLLSRNAKDLGARFPEISGALAELEADDTILDGEIVALDEKGRSSFQRLQGVDLGDRPRLYFYAFDMLRERGEDLRALPLVARKARLAEALEGAPPSVRYSASLEGEYDSLMQRAGELGLEGLIGKRPDSLYEEGRRSGAWIKLKLHEEQEFVIGGFTPPAGSRKHLGALIVGVYDKSALICTGKVGTGFDARSLKALHERLKPLLRADCPFANLPQQRSQRFGQAITASVMKTCRWVDPELVCQVRFTEWTDGGNLRHPVFLGLREDKSPRRVVREAV